MKPYLLLLTFLFIPLSETFSQGHDMLLGMEGGGGIRSLHGELDPRFFGEISAGVGMAAGLSLQKYLSKSLSIKTSILFTRKGGRSFWQELDANGNVLSSQRGSINFTYISMPVLFKYEFGKKVTYFVNSGPFISTLIAHPYSRFNPLPDFTDEQGALDWGASVGVGCQLPLNEKQVFFLEIRNDVGIDNINDYALIRGSYGTMKTFSANFLVGFLWELQ